MLLISLILKIESESSQLGAQLLLNAGRNHSQECHLQMQQPETEAVGESDFSSACS